jgi:hypothetical protein
MVTSWSKAIRASHYSHRFWHHVWSSPGGNLGDPRPSFMKFVNFSTFLKVAFPIHFQISISHQDSSRTCIARSITVSLVWLILDTRQPWPPCLRGQTANHQVAAGPFCAHGLRPRSRQRQPTPTWSTLSARPYATSAPEPTTAIPFGVRRVL